MFYCHRKVKQSVWCNPKLVLITQLSDTFDVEHELMQRFPCFHRMFVAFVQRLNNLLTR